MPDETFLREEDNWYRLPDWADDPEGADGLEWRMYWLIGDIAGTEACLSVQAKGEAERQHHQFREQLLDRLMRQIEKRLPPHSSFAGPAPIPEERRDDEATKVLHGVTWLLIRDGCVLLEKCEKKARVLGVGEWFVPGGKIEGDETPEQALRREIGEEWPWAGLYDFAPLPIIEGSAVPPGPKGLFMMRPFVVTVGGVPDEQTPEGTPLRWAPIAEALASPVPQVRMMVAAAVEERRETRDEEDLLTVERIREMDGESVLDLFFGAMKMPNAQVEDDVESEGGYLIRVDREEFDSAVEGYLVSRQPLIAPASHRETRDEPPIEVLRDIALRLNDTCLNREPVSVNQVREILRATPVKEPR